MKYDEIQELMQSSYGTENYHRINPFCPYVVVTDGMLTVLEKAECFWLFDMMASYYPEMKKSNEYFFVAKLKVKKNNSAEFSIVYEKYDYEKEDGVDVKLCSQKIPFTDLPCGEYKFFIGTQPVEDKTYYVIMCPSEY